MKGREGGRGREEGERGSGGKECTLKTATVSEALVDYTNAQGDINMYCTTLHHNAQP